MPPDTMLVFRYHVPVYPVYPETSLHREPLVEGCRSPPSAKYAKDGAPTDFRHVKGGPPASSIYLGRKIFSLMMNARILSLVTATEKIRRTKTATKLSNMKKRPA